MNSGSLKLYIIPTDAEQRLAVWSQEDGKSDVIQHRIVIYSWVMDVFEPGPITAAEVHSTAKAVGLSDIIYPDVATVEARLEELVNDGLLNHAQLH